MRAITHVLLLLLLLGSCISGNYTSFSRNEPVRDEDLARLQLGESDLGACPQALGAPTRVWEAGNDRIALAYTWLGQGDWGVSVSYSITQFVSVRLSFDSVEVLTQGVVLIFDQDLRLISMERGLLNQITE